MNADLYSPYCGEVWRLVEAQHIVSTMKLVDSAEEQELLEAALDQTKPPAPPECAHLHYLMATPFRYGQYPADSRFRRKGETPGVFYAAEDAETAVAETVWRRRRFFDASPSTPLPRTPGAYTAFAVLVRAPVAIDLTVSPAAEEGANWNDADDYSDCLDLADRVRSAGCELIRYASARHPEARPNIAVLSCRAFEGAEPTRFQTWALFLRPGRAQARREHPKLSLEFETSAARLTYITPGDRDRTTG